MKSRSIVVLSLAAALITAPATVAPAQAAPATQTSPASVATNAVVPDVNWWEFAAAINAVQAAGFVVQFVFGPVDCGPTTVRWQSPAGGTSAPTGSTVTLEFNSQPGPGQECP